MRKCTSLAGLAVLWLACAAVAVAQQQPGVAAEKLAKIEKAITMTMAAQRIPAMSVAIADRERVLWTNGYGIADLENYVPAKASTVYRLGSISKSITAAAVMQLGERGKLDLDAPIQKYCPAFLQKPWPISPRQLLNHTSGIRHYRGGEDLNARHYKTLVEAFRIFQDDPLLFEPGTKYRYSTYAYTVLGCVLEGASGMRFGDFLRENVWKPAGMDRMVVDEVTVMVPNRTQGYELVNGELRNSTLMDSSYKIPGGGLASTAADLTRFAIAIQNGTLLRPQTVAAMWKRSQLRDGSSVNYGLGWEVAEWKGQRVFAHGGAQQRTSTLLYILPDKGLAVALMANLEHSRLRDLAHEIGDIMGE